VSQLRPMHVTAKLPRRFRWIIRGLRVLRVLGWRPNDAQITRIAAWVTDRSDVEISEGRADPDNSGTVLARSR